MGVILLALAAAVPPASAAARDKPSIYDNKRLWATVNVCDTVGHPDAIGIRGSMPGSGDRKEEMFMRFGVQYWAPEEKLWHNLGPGADSGWVDVGSARYRTRESGRTFTITPPRPGAPAYMLRGVVTFEWREAGEVVRRARKRTGTRRTKVNGSDPIGYSAATCTIS